MFGASVHPNFRVVWVAPDEGQKPACFCSVPEQKCEESDLRHTSVCTGERLQLLLVYNAMCLHAGTAVERHLHHLDGEAKSSR